MKQIKKINQVLGLLVWRCSLVRSFVLWRQRRRSSLVQGFQWQVAFGLPLSRRQVFRFVVVPELFRVLGALLLPFVVYLLLGFVAWLFLG